MSTSNQIHPLVFGRGERGVIPRSWQLIVGRSGHEYNPKKLYGLEEEKFALPLQQRLSAEAWGMAA
jgi:hypothetical protein